MSKPKHKIVVTTGKNDRIIAVCENCKVVIFDDNNVKASLNRINSASRAHKKGIQFIQEKDIAEWIKSDTGRPFPDGFREKLFEDFSDDYLDRNKSGFLGYYANGSDGPRAES